ncbi:hypothetical protein BBJ28_00025438, partial [Nothophytophthora sp. Chile5]
MPFASGGHDSLCGKCACVCLIDLPKNSVLFVLNNHRFPKWFYVYDSSITRTQREMTHHLAVYVCQLSSDGPQASSEQRDAAVLARHASPGFTLVSYRRAGSSGNPGCALPALAAADDNLQHSSDQLPLPSDVMDSYSTEILTPQPPSSNAQQLEWRLDAAPESVAVGYPMGARNSLHRREGVVDGDTDGDAIYWQYDARARESRLAEKGSHLLILWRFLACVSVMDLGVDFGLQQRHIRTHWLRAAAALRAPSTSANQHLETVMSSFLRGFWRNPPTDSPEQLPDRSQLVIQASADLFLRAFTSRTVQQLLHSALAPGGQESNKPQLRKRFVTLVSELHGALDELLRVVPPTLRVVSPGSPVSLPALVDEVLSLIYSQRRFGVLRTEVSTLLLAPQPPGSLSEALDSLFRAFTAQTQDTFIATGLRRRGEVQRPVAWSGDADTRQSAWSRRWLLDPGSIRIVPASIGQNQDSSFEPSLVEVVHWLHEFACIDIAVRDDASCCSIWSVLSLVSEMSPKELVLDGRLRVFRVMPSGLSSMVAVAGRWAVGDYVASFSDDTQSLEMTFYAFAEGGSAMPGRDGSGRETTAVRQARVTFVLQQEL